MNRRHTLRKAAYLFSPLLVFILGLHAWGDGLAGGLGRAVTNWQYPEHEHPPFLIRVPRRSDADGLAARALEEFVSGATRNYGTTLGLSTPAAPVRVLLLDADADPRRFGWNAAEDAPEADGLYDPLRRTILVHMERKLQQEPVIAALRRGAARLLLADAGASTWSPWLAEGLAGCLEGAKEPELHGWSADLPTVAELLGAPEVAFLTRTAPTYPRAARLLVAWLLEQKKEGFLRYIRAERQGAPDLPGQFERWVGDPGRLDTEWRASTHPPK